MSTVQTALRFNPRLYEEAEKERALTKALSDHEHWQPMIDKAIEETKKLDAEEEKRKKLLEEQEERRRNRKKQNALTHQKAADFHKVSGF